MLSFFENKLNTGDKILKAFQKYKHSKSYDCENNFAPVTIFDINEMKNFE